MSRRSIGKLTGDDVSRRPSNSTHNFFDQDFPNPGGVGVQASLQDLTNVPHSSGGLPHNGERRRVQPDDLDEETLAILNAHGFIMTEPGLEHALAAMDHQADGPRPEPELQQGPTENPDPNQAGHFVMIREPADASSGDMQLNLPTIASYVASLAAIANNARNYAFRDFMMAPSPEIMNPEPNNIRQPEGNFDNNVGGIPVGNWVENEHQPLPPQGEIIDERDRVRESTPTPLQSLADGHGGGLAAGAAADVPIDNQLLHNPDTVWKGGQTRHRPQELQMNPNKTTGDTFNRDLESFSALIVTNVIEKAADQHKQESARKEKHEKILPATNTEDLNSLDSAKENVLSVTPLDVAVVSSSKSPVRGDQYDYESDFEVDEEEKSCAKSNSNMSVKESVGGHEKDSEVRQRKQGEMNTDNVVMCETISQVSVGPKKSTRMHNLSGSHMSPVLSKGKEEKFTPRTPTERKSTPTTPKFSDRTGKKFGQGREKLDKNTPNATSQSRYAASKIYGVKKNEKSSPARSRKTENKLPPVKTQNQDKKSHSSNTPKGTSRPADKINARNEAREKRGKQTGSLSTVKRNPNPGRVKAPTPTKTPKLPPLERKNGSQEKTRGEHHHSADPRRPDQLIRALGAGARKLRDMEKPTMSETTVHEHDNKGSLTSNCGAKRTSNKTVGGGYDPRRGSGKNVTSARLSKVENRPSYVDGSALRASGRQRLKPSVPSVLKSEAYWQNGQLHIRINGSARLIPQAEKIIEEQGVGENGETVPLDVRITLLKGEKPPRVAAEKTRRPTGGVSKGYNGPLAYPELGVSKNPSRTVAERTILDTRTVHAPFNTRTARVRGMPRRPQRSGDSATRSGAGKL